MPGVTLRSKDLLVKHLFSWIQALLPALILLNYHLTFLYTHTVAGVMFFVQRFIIRNGKSHKRWLAKTKHIFLYRNVTLTLSFILHFLKKGVIPASWWRADISKVHTRTIHHSRLQMHHMTWQIEKMLFSFPGIYICGNLTEWWSAQLDTYKIKSQFHLSELVLQHRPKSTSYL